MHAVVVPIRTDVLAHGTCAGARGTTMCCCSSSASGPADCCGRPCEFAGSPRELEEFAEMVRHAARRGDPQIGMLMNDEGVTPIIVASHDEYGVADVPS